MNNKVRRLKEKEKDKKEEKNNRHMTKDVSTKRIRVSRSYRKRQT